MSQVRGQRYLSSLHGLFAVGIGRYTLFNTLAPTTLSWFPRRACFYRHKRRLKLIIRFNCSPENKPNQLKEMS